MGLSLRLGLGLGLRLGLGVWLGLALGLGLGGGLEEPSLTASSDYLLRPTYNLLLTSQHARLTLELPVEAVELALQP